MLRKNLLIVLACFCFGYCPVLAEEGPILPVNTWAIYNNHYFNHVLKYYCHASFQNNEELEKQMALYDFPREIDSESPWYGMTLTDGKEMWKVIFLWIKDEHTSLESLDILKIHGKLASHPIIQAYFENDQTQAVFHVGNNLEISAGEQFQFSLKQNWPSYNPSTITERHLELSVPTHEPSLIIVSQSFPFERIKASQLAAKWFALQRQTPFAYLIEYPDRILLPELPPEKDDEPPFVKYVRKSRKDGKMSQGESDLWGIRWDKDTWEFFQESVAAEGTEKAEERKRWTSCTQPFQVGGFCGGSEGYFASWRMVPEISLSENLVLTTGTVLLIPEEQGETNNGYHFRLTWSLNSITVEELEQYGIVLSDGSLHCIYPDQPKGIEPREGLATPETLDALNRSLAESFLALLVDLRKSAMSTGGEEPIDFAAQFGNEGIYVAIAFPPGLKPVEWNSFQKVIDVLSQHASLPRLDDDGNPTADENWKTILMKSCNSEIHEGVVYQKFELFSTRGDRFENYFEEGMGRTPLFGVFGVGEDFFCLAIPRFWDDDCITLDHSAWDIAAQSETFLANLKEKVQISRDLQEEGMPTPITLLRGNSDGWRYSVENETFERKTIYRLKVGADSFNNVYTLARQFGLDMGEMLPF